MSEQRSSNIAADSKQPAINLPTPSAESAATARASQTINIAIKERIYFDK